MAYLYQKESLFRNYLEHLLLQPYAIFVLVNYLTCCVVLVQCILEFVVGLTSPIIGFDLVPRLFQKFPVTYDPMNKIDC